tara:strand:+ start:46 stop:1422 length:1377 start_codon:yes stop_codon:yes gene_type:complete
MKFIRKINWYLNYSYHRPSAKIEALFESIQRLAFIEKSRPFSERELLVKKAQSKLIFYNHIGLLLMNIRNTFSIIFLNKFWDKDIYLEDINNPEKNIYKEKKLNPFKWSYIRIISTPKNSISEIKKQISDSFSAYRHSCNMEKSNKELSESEWWMKNQLKFAKDFGLDIDNEEKRIKLISRFRDIEDSEAMIIADNFRLWPRGRNHKLNLINALHIVNQYHHFAKRINPAILTWVSDLRCGNNRCVIYRGQRLNERTLRHAYYSSQILEAYKHLGGFKNGHKTILDIGGAYGGLIRYLKLINQESTCILVDLPEIIYLADYFLSNAFPNAKILRSNNKNILEILSQENKFKEFDFVLLPPSLLDKLAIYSVDLTINTTSLGEMSPNSQEYYAEIVNTRTREMFYSVNRFGGTNRKLLFNECPGISEFALDNNWVPIALNSTHTYHFEQALLRTKNVNN